MGLHKIKFLVEQSTVQAIQQYQYQDQASYVPSMRSHKVPTEIISTTYEFDIP